MLAFQDEPPDESLHAHVLSCEGILLIFAVFYEPIRQGNIGAGTCVVVCKGKMGYVQLMLLFTRENDVSCWAVYVQRRKKKKTREKYVVRPVWQKTAWDRAMSTFTWSPHGSTGTGSFVGPDFLKLFSWSNGGDCLLNLIDSQTLIILPSWLSLQTKPAAHRFLKRRHCHILPRKLPNVLNDFVNVCRLHVENQSALIFYRRTVVVKAKFMNVINLYRWILICHFGCSHSFSCPGIKSCIWKIILTHFSELIFVTGCRSFSFYLLSLTFHCQ